MHCMHWRLSPAAAAIELKIITIHMQYVWWLTDRMEKNTHILRSNVFENIRTAVSLSRTIKSTGNFSCAATALHFFINSTLNANAKPKHTQEYTSNRLKINSFDRIRNIFFGLITYRMLRNRVVGANVCDFSFIRLLSTYPTQKSSCTTPNIFVELNFLSKSHTTRGFVVIKIGCECATLNYCIYF